MWKGHDGDVYVHPTTTPRSAAGVVEEEGIVEDEGVVKEEVDLDEMVEIEMEGLDVEIPL